MCHVLCGIGTLQWSVRELGHGRRLKASSLFCYMLGAFSPLALSFSSVVRLLSPSFSFGGEGGGGGDIILECRSNSLALAQEIFDIELARSYLHAKSIALSGVFRAY